MVAPLFTFMRSGSWSSAAMGKLPKSTSCSRIYIAAVYVSTNPMSRPIMLRESGCGCSSTVTMSSVIAANPSRTLHTSARAFAMFESCTCQGERDGGEVGARTRRRVGANVRAKGRVGGKGESEGKSEGEGQG